MGMKQSIAKLSLSTLIADREIAKDRRHFCLTAIQAGHPKSADQKIDYEVDLEMARKIIVAIDTEIERRQHQAN